MPWAPVALERDLTDAEGARAVAMLLTRDDVTGSMSDKLLTDCAANGTAFTWLAARREQPDEVAAALDAMASCAESLHPADHHNVVATRLRDPDPRVSGAALRAAGSLLPHAGPGDAVFDAVVFELGDASAPVRYEAVTALDAAPWRATDAGDAAVLAALDDASPPVRSEALRMIADRSAGGWSDERFSTRALSMATDDIDPGIRGRALDVVVAMSPDAPQTQALARTLLDDPQPYTRARAASALGALGDLSAVHPLMERVDDSDEAVWTMRPWVATDGSEWVQHHIGSPHERVDDAVLMALQALTADLGEGGFRYRDINPEWVELDIVSATRDARRWYEAHRQELPD